MDLLQVWSSLIALINRSNQMALLANPEELTDLKESISNQLRVMDSTVKHLNEIMLFTKVNMDQQVKNMSQRHALIAEPDEPGTFPNKILPFSVNQKFYGRKDELEKIYASLKPKGDQSYRTYTIYGRRGVGKTEMALQFAHANPADYDAVFWVQCETSVAIRQSFTEIAVALELPGACRDGHHEENLLAVKVWLKRTSSYPQNIPPSILANTLYLRTTVASDLR
jgi:hypothetical protein